MFTNSHVSNTFTIIGLIADSTLKFINDTRSKIFGNPIFEMKVITTIKDVFLLLLQLSPSL